MKLVPAVVLAALAAAALITNASAHHSGGGGYDYRWQNGPLSYGHQSVVFGGRHGPVRHVRRSPYGARYGASRGLFGGQFGGQLGGQYGGQLGGQYGGRPGAYDGPVTVQHHFYHHHRAPHYPHGYRQSAPFPRHAHGAPFPRHAHGAPFPRPATRGFGFRQGFGGQAPAPGFAFQQRPGFGVDFPSVRPGFAGQQGNGDGNVGFPINIRDPPAGFAADQGQGFGLGVQDQNFVDQNFAVNDAFGSPVVEDVQQALTFDPSPESQTITSGGAGSASVPSQDAVVVESSVPVNQLNLRTQTSVVSSEAAALRQNSLDVSDRLSGTREVSSVGPFTTAAPAPITSVTSVTSVTPVTPITSARLVSSVTPVTSVKLVTPVTSFTPITSVTTVTPFTTFASPILSTGPVLTSSSLSDPRPLFAPTTSSVVLAPAEQSAATTPSGVSQSFPVLGRLLTSALQPAVAPAVDQGGRAGRGYTYDPPAGTKIELGYAYNAPAGARLADDLAP